MGFNLNFILTFAHEFQPHNNRNRKIVFEQVKIRVFEERMGSLLNELFEEVSINEQPLDLKDMMKTLFSLRKNEFKEYADWNQSYSSLHQKLGQLKAVKEKRWKLKVFPLFQFISFINQTLKGGC